MARDREWSLRYTHGTQRVLMYRWGPKEDWKDIATFESYNDAYIVLDLLNAAEEKMAREKLPSKETLHLLL